MSKDGIQAFADEVTLIRHEIDRLQRSSLDKDEAEALHRIVAQAVADMRKATREAPQALQSALRDDRDRMAREATVAATSAAQEAVRGIRANWSLNATSSLRAPHRPAEPPCASPAASGPSWPLCSPQGCFWAS